MFVKIKTALGDKVFKVTGSNNLGSHPVCLTAEGEVSLEMEKVLARQAGAPSEIKAKRVLEININHPIYKKLESASEEELNSISEILYSQAVLIAGLEIENPTKIAELIINELAK